MKKKALLIPLALLLAVSLVAIGCPATETPTQPTTPTGETIKLIAANWTPTQMPPPLEWEPFDFALNYWMDAIELETNGRVEFERYPQGTLVGMTDMWEAVKVGVCDIGLVNVCAFPGQFPMTTIMRLPGLFDSSTQGAIVRQRLLEEGYLAHDWEDVKVLWMGNNSHWSVSCREKQIRTLEDLKGLKIANVGEPESSFIEALGAVPIAMPATDFYMALKRGTVDGAWQDTNGQVAFKLYEVSPYITRIPGNGNAAVVTVMNLDKYNSLPPDVKAVFDRNIGLFEAAAVGRRFDLNDSRAIAFLNERKGFPPVYTLTEEERARWFKAAEPLIEAAIANLEAQGLPAREMFDRAHELVELYKSLGF